MNGQTLGKPNNLVGKIARLVEERGWNQEDFARITGLNRHTVRLIFQPNAERRMRNATVSACARALGFSVSELRDLPLDQLLARIRGQQLAENNGVQRRLYEMATQPELVHWLERNGDRARDLTEEEIDEMLSLQGTGGPLTGAGVERYVEMIERKRRVIQQIHAVAGTEYFEVLEKLVLLMYEKIQPYANRT